VDKDIISLLNECVSAYVSKFFVLISVVGMHHKEAGEEGEGGGGDDNEDAKIF
jgi:hypothetical protein